MRGFVRLCFTLSDLDHPALRLTKGLEAEEQTEVDQIEEKLKDAIDLTTQKSQQGRVSALKTLCNFLSLKYLPYFVFDRRMTLQDCAERALKKGKCAEQQEGGKLASLLCFQMGPTLDTETLYKDMRSLFLTLINDTSLGIGAREQCCYTLSILCFVASHNLEEIEDIMKALSNVFKQKLPSDSPQLSALHSAALASWSLLYTLLPSKRVYDSAEANVTMLLKLLESGDVDLRITAGEAIALVYEGARDFDDEFTLANDSEDKNTGDLESELCNMLKSLATDSQKFRAKKDRRQQRSSFRDVLRAVEEGDTPDVHIKFGTEVLVLDSWSRKKQYDAICQVLGSGMNLHLAENEFLRDIFDLGPPMLVGGVTTKVSKSERHAMNMANFKSRSIARQKNRDKRVAAF
ncbi:interferon-related developmental regulator 1-like isoform X2 [Artemia franciscana]|uniref:interferon-related developmental regulator 1-like isoform X2 n=1 Tax=Artemia franciscana TaxID=6661 RepID=UPI0032DBE1AC